MRPGEGDWVQVGRGDGKRGFFAQLRAAASTEAGVPALVVAS